jgi:hypothetical protein
MSDGQLARKFATLAGERLGDRQAASLLDAAWSLDKAKTIEPLAALFRGAASAV